MGVGAGGPAWSPDGARIAFASNRSGAPELYMMNSDGSNVVRVTTQVGFVWSRPTWAPDSRRLAFGCEIAPGNREICVIDAYTATIRVADPLAEVATATQMVAVTRGAMHVGDIDATSVIQQSAWSAAVTITMHDEGHRPLANAVVKASWNGGAAVSCTTGAAGSCVLTRSKIPRNASVNLTVLGASSSNFFYASAGNHDPDGGSNGTTISISRQ